MREVIDTYMLLIYKQKKGTNRFYNFLLIKQTKITIDKLITQVDDVHHNKRPSVIMSL
jgi:hypothetical protein